jgi:hypothetical protein
MTNSRALLFTDIVDSTGVSQALVDAESARLRQQHDRVPPALLASWEDWEIDKADGMFAMFQTSARAVGYAGAY